MRLVNGLVLGLGVVVLSGCIEGKPQVKLETDKQKFSYAIGQRIGGDLKSRSLDVDTDVLAASIREAVEGKKERMTEKEMRDVFFSMQKKMAEDEKKEAEENVKKGDEFLASNAKKDGIKVLESGLQYKVVSEGKGSQPKAEDRVKVHYKGTLIDGTEFDSSHKRGEPAEFPLNAVIPGWTEGLQLMKEGAKYMFYIPSKLAYGPRATGTIPANSVLVFEVELLEILGSKDEKKK